MTLTTYAAWVRQVAERTGKGSWAAAADPDRELAYLGLGLTGEAGEVAEHIKKRLRDGNWDADAVVGELGDVIYYWVRLCLAVGRDPADVLAASRAKIDRVLAERIPKRG
jgi:NTP pyrophosphatase (non-canonical NTP hydrolase)